MAMDGKLLRGLFEHERFNPAVLKTDRGIVTTLSALKKVMNLEITLWRIKHGTQREFSQEQKKD